MGLTKNDVGVAAGIRLICPWAVSAPWLAVIVTAVAVVTALVCIANEVPGAPAGMVTAEGTTANGEFVERFTMTPPAGATLNPARSTHPVMVAPPVATPGNDWRGLLLSVGGSTVNWPEAEAPLSVALIVNVPVVDHAVLAFVVGEESPCCDSTRQNLGPAVSDCIRARGSVYWLLNASIVENVESLATCQT